MAQCRRLPIEKYSYATNAAVTASSLRWNHLADNDMAILLEKSAADFDGGRISLKVMQGAAVLESVPLQQLCQRAEEASNQGGVQNLTDLPISVVMKCPRVAVTYSIGNGQSKRIQIRLLHDQDWDVVIKLLRDLRCPMRESQDRPSTAGGPFPVSNHRASGEFSVAADRPEPTRPDSASASLANRSQPSFSGLRVPHPPQSYTNSRQQPATHEFPSNLEQPLSTPFAESSYKYQPSNLQTPMLHNGDGFLSMFPRSNPFGNPDIDTPAPESLGLSAGTLSQMLPPRRELPFPDRPSSSPTKPKTGVRRSRPVSTSSTSNKRPKTSAKPPAPRTSTAKVAQPIEAPKTPSALNSLDPNSTSSSRRPSANLPSTAEGVPPSGHSVSSPRTENEQIATLQAYASKPSRDRQILIDNMITQYIGDDSFTTLCEDVENAWKRIGLDAGS